MLPGMLQTEGVPGLPGPGEAPRRGGGKRRGLVLALLLFAPAAGIVLALWFAVAISAGAAGGCGGG
jgi:hypothetical protein